MGPVCVTKALFLNFLSCVSSFLSSNWKKKLRFNSHVVYFCDYSINIAYTATIKTWCQYGFKNGSQACYIKVEIVAPSAVQLLTVYLPLWTDYDCIIVPEIVRAMTHVINQGMSMYWGTSRWSAMEIMVSNRNIQMFMFISSCLHQQ